MNTGALDMFLSQALRASLGGAAPEVWPPNWPDEPATHDAVIARIGFHGIALVLLGNPASIADWPRPVQDALRAEARGQSFWEAGHREVAVRLIEALAQAGIRSIFTKGTALAYSAYPEPAMRRRGDSDVLIPEAARRRAVKALRASGFRRIGDVQPLQEIWAADCRLGYVHAFDLHWRVNSSPVLAQALERGGVGTRTVPLARLHDGASGLALTDSLLLVAINRASHETFGYYVGNVRQFDQNRLIWALDVDLICGALDEAGWQLLLETTKATGTAQVVRSALDFAAMRLGTAVPAHVGQALAAQAGDAAVMRSLGELPGLERLRLNLAASPTFAARLRMLRYTLFPRSQSMRERFPDTAHWPLPALYARRLWSGLRPGQRRDA